MCKSQTQSVCVSLEKLDPKNSDNWSVYLNRNKLETQFFVSLLVLVYIIVSSGVSGIARP